jgi:N-acetylmuramoyl-L-alanine amidase
MRRAISWFGLLLLATSFVWFVRLTAPRPPSTAERKPALRGEGPLVVVLDPGHGGQDSGAMSGTMLEKDLSLDVALRAERLLRAAGFTTVLTRARDRYVSLADRASLGNREDNSLFVSIHFNEGAGPAISGVETYYALRQSISPPGFFSWLSFLQRADAAPLMAASESLASFIQAALVEKTQAVNRGTKPEQFYVMAHVRHPAALVEGGFLTNKSDVTKLATTEYRQQIASAIRDGVRHYRDAIGAGQPTLTLAAARSE